MTAVRITALAPPHCSFHTFLSDLCFSWNILISERDFPRYQSVWHVYTVYKAGWLPAFGAARRTIQQPKKGDTSLTTVASPIFSFLSFLRPLPSPPSCPSAAPSCSYLHLPSPTSQFTFNQSINHHHHYYHHHHRISLLLFWSLSYF